MFNVNVVGNQINVNAHPNAGNGKRHRQIFVVKLIKRDINPGFLPLLLNLGHCDIYKTAALRS